MKTDFEEAQQYIAGGVNSPVRAFRGLDMDPIFIERGKGKTLVARGGKRYIDFCLSWGSLVLGHAHPRIINAVRKTLSRGTSFGAPTVLETELARLICTAVPSCERLRFVNSGTEALMTAIRLARAFTKRDTILKFDGCYHGHSDSLLVSAGSGVTGILEASSKGIPTTVTAKTISIPFNDNKAFLEIMERHGSEIALVVTEPVPANMGLVLPLPGFLECLREETRRRGALLCMDEVITGFRLGPGGAQEMMKVSGDLVCFGKIIGGGFPVGAVGGKKEIMDLLAPSGPVYQAGTLSGNPVAMTAGITTLEYLLSHQEIYGDMASLIEDFTQKWKRHSPCTINAVGSMFTIFATENSVRDFKDAQQQDPQRFGAFYRAALAQGLYLPPSRFETAFVSPLHTEKDLGRLLDIKI